MVSTVILASTGSGVGVYGLWALCGVAILAACVGSFANYVEAHKRVVASIAATVGALTIIMWDFQGCVYWMCWW